MCGRLLACSGGWAGTEALERALVAAGCPQHEAVDAIWCWVAAGILREERGCVGWGTSLPHAAGGLWPRVVAPAGGLRADGQEVALLSLFDGTGMARLALEEALAEQEGMRLVSAAFVEHDMNLANAVGSAWDRRLQEGRTALPYRHLAEDVWDLLRGADGLSPSNPEGFRDCPLRRFAASLPGGCSVLVLAGSPCQQLTYSGRYRGRQGLCGAQSVHFFVVPAVAWMLRMIRPDVVVHIILENAASMTDRHKGVIMRALGGLRAESNLRTLDSGRWSVFPRRRHYFATVGASEEIEAMAMRPQPWEDGWAPLPPGRGQMAPMMCSRSREGIRASTYQYQPQGLVYRRAGPECGFDWHGCSLDQVRSRILRVMPADVGRRYSRMLRGNLSHREEEWVVPAMEWIEREGPRHGVRTPSPRERARATGRGQYLEELRLSDRDLYNAVGNHFDPDALRMRLREPLRVLAAGAQSTLHEFPAPADLATIYRGLARNVREEGIPVQPAPFPQDLRVALTALHSETGEAPGLRPVSVDAYAEGGMDADGAGIAQDGGVVIARSSVGRDGPGGIRGGSGDAEHDGAVVAEDGHPRMEPDAAGTCCGLGRLASGRIGRESAAGESGRGIHAAAESGRELR